jgi:hypothetical protein
MACSTEVDAYAMIDDVKLSPMKSSSSSSVMSNQLRLVLQVLASKAGAGLKKAGSSTGFGASGDRTWDEFLEEDLAAAGRWVSW